MATNNYQVFTISNLITAQTEHAVVSLTLVNVDTKHDIETITNGATINLATLPTRNLNIQGNINKKARSVVFDLTGKQKH